eukprot:200130-Amorphochlora_amoeboformis.AAC.1
MSPKILQVEHFFFSFRITYPPTLTPSLFDAEAIQTQQQNRAVRAHDDRLLARRRSSGGARCTRRRSRRNPGDVPAFAAEVVE